MDLTASRTALLTGISRRSVNSIFLKLRERIAFECELASPFKSAEVEVDESYFGARFRKGKRGRGAYGKHIVFGILKRNGYVYTEIVPDVRKHTLQSIIRGRVALDSVIHSDGWRGYNGLVDVGYQKHYRVIHSNDEFANQNLLIRIRISTVLKASGLLPKEDFISLTASPRKLSTCTLKNASLDLTTGQRTCILFC